MKHPARRVWAFGSGSMGMGEGGRRMRRILHMALEMPLVLLLSTCGGEGGPDPTGPGAPTPAALSLDESQLDLWVGATRVVIATARDASGATLDVSPAWSSSDTTVVRVTTGGFVTGLSHGTATVTAAVSGLTATATVRVEGLLEPLLGVVNQDYFYTNYVDQQAGPGIGDYACGSKSYDGHLGVDIVLPDFRKMDEGVDVVASAQGTVVQAHDGEFDRNKAWGPSDWNVVVLEHGEQLQTVYGHLKRGSVAVAVGDVITAGTKLGEVGSSGRSDMPHLHLELRQGGDAVDPYGGPCSWGREYFREPLPYQDAFHLIATEVTDRALSLELVKDGLPPADTIGAASDRVTGWVHLHNKAANAVVRFTLFRPDGSLHGSVNVVRPEFYSMSWWWAWWDRSALDPWPGRWTMEVHYNGERLATRSFELIGVASARAPGARGPRTGTGGGAARADVPWESNRN